MSTPATPAADYDTELHRFLEDDDINIYAFELKKSSSSSSSGGITITVADDMEFTIHTPNPTINNNNNNNNNTFRITTSDPILSTPNGWLHEVSSYIANSNKNPKQLTLRDVLVKCTVAYTNNLPDDDDDSSSSTSTSSSSHNNNNSNSQQHDDGDGDDLDDDIYWGGAQQQQQSTTTSTVVDPATSADRMSLETMMEQDPTMQRMVNKLNSSSNKPPSSSTTTTTTTSSSTGTGSANHLLMHRLMKDYLALAKHPERTRHYGYTAHPVGEDLLHWQVKLFGFQKISTNTASTSSSRSTVDDQHESTLAQDLDTWWAKWRRSGSGSGSGSDHDEEHHILLDMRFPPEYPFRPPFIRIVTPRFQYLTGHVTIGGSVCMELLTTSGWSPGNSIESVLVQIRSELIAGGARVDTGNMAPYSEHEAKEAFHRVSRRYGWEK